MNRFFLLVVSFPLLAVGILGCAATAPPRITRVVLHTPPPDPEALGHYIDAKLYEIKGQPEQAVGALRAATAIDSSSATLYGSLARNLNELTQFTDAVDPAGRAVRLDPQDSENRWLLVHALLNGRRDTSAVVDHLESLAHIDPNPVRAFEFLLNLYGAQNRRADVLRTLDNIASLRLLNTQGRLALAANYARNNAHDRAKATYRRIAGEDPNHEEVWHQYGSHVLAAGDSLEAERIFRKGLAHFGNRLRPQTGPLWGQLVAIYGSDRILDTVLSEDPFDTEFAEPLVDVFVAIARRDPETAERKYGRAKMLLDRMAEGDSTRSELWGKKAKIMLATDRAGEARAAFERAIRIDNKAQHWLGLAHTYLAQNRLDDAVGILRKLHDEAPLRSPLYPQIVFALGGAYTGVGRIQDARAVYLRASQADPGEVRYRYELGRTYALERDWEKAVPVFEALAEQLDCDAELLRRTLFQLGRCLERGGRIEAAVAVLQRLLTLDPDDHQALNYLGYTLVDRGIRLKEAEQLIQRALDADPQNGAYLDSMGWVYYQQGRYKEALDHLVRAANVEEAEARNLPPDPRSRAAYYEELSIIHDHIGDTARALLDYDMARRHWKRALECDPAGEAVRKKLQALDAPASGAPGGP